MKSNKWNTALNVQLILAILAIFTYLNTLSPVLLGVNLFLEVLLIFILVTNLFVKNGIINRINVVAKIVCLPLIFRFVLGLFFNNLTNWDQKLTVFLAVIYWCINLWCYLPIIMTEYGRIKNGILRIICIFLLFFNLNLNGNYLIQYGSLLSSLDGVMSAIAFLIIAISLARVWNFKFVLGTKQISISQVIITVVLIIFSVWYAFFNATVYQAVSINEAIWQWNFDEFNPSLVKLLDSLQAGVIEEVERYLVLVVSLIFLKNKKFQISISILISAFLFGMSHYMWLIKRHSFIRVTRQAFSAFGVGIFLAVVLLYTGQIWLTMLMHFLVDFVTMSHYVNSVGFLAVYGKNAADGLIIIIDCFFILLMCLMLTGSRRKIIKRNISQFLK